MSSASDFIIENGVLKKYIGPGGNVVIPDGVTSIGTGAFSFCGSLTSVTIPEGVTSIGRNAFRNCYSLKNLTMSERTTNIGDGAFIGCRALADAEGFVVVGNTMFQYAGSAKSVVIRPDVTRVGEAAFSRNYHLLDVTIPGSITGIGPEAFADCKKLRQVTLLCAFPNGSGLGGDAFLHCDELSEILAPFVPLSAWIEEKLGIAAAAGFIAHSKEYKDAAIADEYVRYVSSQRKKLLPMILRNDRVEILRLLAEAKKITKKNLESDYLIPAEQSKAEKCVEYLNSVFHNTDTSTKTHEKRVERPGLWDGIHFSFDGKKLLKYPEETERKEYIVPEGTIEIGKEAFFRTPLEKILLPESLTTIRNNAFTAKSGIPLFVRLPQSIKNLPSEAFVGETFDEDMDADDETKYYYISSPLKALADDLCVNSYNRGYRCMIYTGGPLDDLPAKAKPFAVRGFLYAMQNQLEDLSRWRNNYLEHIRRNEKTYIKQAFTDAYLFHLMMEEALLSAKGTQSILEEAVTGGRSDMIAPLLEYGNAHFGDREQMEELADHDPALTCQLKALERREKIRDQKGIKRMTFVSTGALNEFGTIDYYTGAHDFSDLKDFIEKRGGFYRGAVSSKTDYLICNNPNSNSTKSKKAKELGVPVITEEEFIQMAKEAKEVQP